MVLTVLRVVFLVAAAGFGVYLLAPGSVTGPAPPSWIVYLVLALAGLVIAVDIAVPRKRIEVVSAVFFGLLIGLVLTNVVSIALFPHIAPRYENVVRLALSIVNCYLCISLLVQTKDDIRFIIPYVEFARDIKGIKPLVLDTSAVIDGRIADVMETRLFDSPLIMPRCVLQELQNIADSNDRLRRSRGRRGLDILHRLRGNRDIDFKIYDREPPDMADQPVDMKLILLTKHLDGKLVTGDFNLNKVARIHNVPVFNLNDLANALKPVFLPGEHLTVLVVKPGEEEGQGIGYLDDGTMIVIEGGRPHVQQQVKIGVTSVLQTSAGRMIFGRFEQLAEQQANPRATSAANV